VEALAAGERVPLTPNPTAPNTKNLITLLAFMISTTLLHRFLTV
jgi:hypothetical protein